VGRRGIPFLDWGLHPGRDWIINQDYSVCGPYNNIKSVAYKAQEGTYTQNGFNLATAININLIRFADILLWAAEVEILLPGGSLEKARDYVNQVRTRAMNPAGFVHTYLDPANPTKGFTNIPAANYKIDIYKTAWTDPVFALKAVQYERMLELGMEGHRFFDLVRWGIASTTLNAFFQKEKNLRHFLSDAQFTPGKNEYFPIPQTEIDLSAGADGRQTLIQNPGYH
jgi:starch-binding outer membrane protein, SusD/RagB family